MAHELAESAMNPSALEDGSGCWSGAGFEHVDVCSNQIGLSMARNSEGNFIAIPSMVIIPIPKSNLNQL